ncbi:MAG: DUF6364 family protein [Bacteroidota bacterium]
MATAKLTLSIDKDLIAIGKQIARERGTSLSKLVAQYFQEINKEREPYLIVEPDPELAALMLQAEDTSPDANYTAEFSEYYANKHLADPAKE